MTEYKVIPVAVFAPRELGVREKTPIRKAMEALAVGEGFEFTTEKEWNQVQSARNQLRPKGMRFSVRKRALIGWILRRDE